MNEKNSPIPEHRRRNWTWIFMPRAFDLVSSLLYVGVLVTFFTYDCGCAFLWWRTISITLSVVALLTIDRIEYWLYGEIPPVKGEVYLFAARVVLIELVAWLDYFRFSPFLYLLLPFLALMYFGRKPAYIVTIAVWSAYTIKEVLRESGTYAYQAIIHDLSLFTIALVFAMTMARAVTRERESRLRTEQLLTELEASNQQLKSYAQQVEELATTKERNRLARDIHDTLGHYLTVINVQLEKALAYRKRKPEEADQAVSDAKRLASEALQDIRRSVSALRSNQDMFTFSPALTDLVERIQSSKFSVTMQITGSEEGFSKQVLIALYRAAQEGLTNIQKHAQASSARLDVDFKEHEAVLALRDNGVGFEPKLLEQLQPGRSGRYGLQGVRERLELLGGSLHIESEPGKGTCLIATCPKELSALDALSHQSHMGLL